MFRHSSRMVSFMSCPFVYKYILLLNPHIIGFISLVFFITLPVYETFMIFILSLLLKEKYKIYERRKQKCQRRKDAKKNIIIRIDSWFNERCHLVNTTLKNEFFGFTEWFQHSESFLTDHCHNFLDIRCFICS